jgi:hypothetical protein
VTCHCGFPMVETRAGQFECLLSVWERQHQAATEAEGFATVHPNVEEQP